MVSELDLLRLCAVPDYMPVVAAWNWCRMPAGANAVRETATTVAMFPGVVPRMPEWLGRDVATTPTGVSAVDALTGVLS